MQNVEQDVVDVVCSVDGAREEMMTVYTLYSIVGDDEEWNSIVTCDSLGVSLEIAEKYLWQAPNDSYIAIRVVDVPRAEFEAMPNFDEQTIN